jgi:lysophospholipase L1-like esterase
MAQAADNNIPLVDYHTALEASNAENYITALTLDGVHPSSQGYIVMTPLAEEAVRRIRSGRRKAVSSLSLPIPD